MTGARPRAEDTDRLGKAGLVEAEPRLPVVRGPLALCTERTSQAFPAGTRASEGHAAGNGEPLRLLGPRLKGSCRRLPDATAAGGIQMCQEGSAPRNPGLNALQEVCPFPRAVA